MRELAELYDRMKEAEPHRFKELLRSKSEDTDVLFLKLVRDTTGLNEDVTSEWMERVAMFMMEEVWRYFKGAPNVNSSLEYVLDKLSNQPSLSILRDIVLAKEAYLGRYIWPFYDEDYVMCSVLTCTSPMFFVMNGMKYCDDHRGLAFVYGFRARFLESKSKEGEACCRHECRTCRIFSLTAMKETGTDWNHQWFNFNTMTSVSLLSRGMIQVPLRTRDGKFFNVSIRHHCSDDYDERRDRARFYADDSNVSTAMFLWKKNSHVTRAYEFHLL